MADDAKEPREARRLFVRRSRGARFSRAAAREEGTPRDFDDEVDEAIDPESVDRHVRARASQPPTLERYTEPGVPGAPDPRQRMFDVAASGSAAYSKEYRLNLLHRLLLRRIPLDQIARQLGVSISTVEKDRAELKKRLREVARELDIDEMIGNQSGLYEEVSGLALRIASNNTGDDRAPLAMQLAAMRTALAANADKTRFYQSAGVFDALRFRRSETGDSVSDVQLLMQRTQAMLQELAESGGFQAFDSNDADDPEILDL